jgi:hypothetical protein
VTGEALIRAAADSGRWKTANAELGAGLRSWYYMEVNTYSIVSELVTDWKISGGQSSP